MPKLYCLAAIFVVLNPSPIQAAVDLYIILVSGTLATILTSVNIANVLLTSSENSIVCQGMKIQICYCISIGKYLNH